MSSELIEDPKLQLALRFGMRVVAQPPALNWPTAWEEKLAYHFCKRHGLLPLFIEGEVVVAATSDPLALAGPEELRLLLGAEVETRYCAAELLNAATEEAFRERGRPAADLLERLDTIDEADEGDLEVYDLLDTRYNAPIVRLLNAILSEAIQQGASDIHFEPFESDLKVRYRIDGVLQTRHWPRRDSSAQLLARLKVMAKLDIAEHRLPQDGRIKLRMGGREIDFRVSTIPVTNGERIVLRILDRGAMELGLDRSGMPLDLAEQFRRLVQLPEGILLVTGPTGSGKTTTLYSALTELNRDEINIMTIEDPVEYKLPGIAQIGVKPKIGLTFAAGLRHILRQDPDVVMVGEIRDRETAEIAVQASLTGHLVLSTLHTNDAPSALTRLTDMGIEPYLLSSSVAGVLAQRLVRTLCSHCAGGELRSQCTLCLGSGFKGRIGLYELMRITPKVRKQLVISPDASQLRKIALEEGMMPLAEAGQRLVREGRTTMAEVVRVTATASEI